MEHILLRHREIPDINTLNVYEKNGGFAAFKNAVTNMKPNEVTDVVKNSGLRGRGGAGFPTGMKWSFIDNKNWPHYVVVNADESEPGTFKDREIMEGNPFQFLEGVALASYAVGANVAYVYLRGEFWELGAVLDEKIAEMEEAGYLGDKLTWAQVHTSVVKRQPCLNHSKANVDSRAFAHHSRLRSVCMENRPSSTMLRHLPMYHLSFLTARTGTNPWAQPIVRV